MLDDLLELRVGFYTGKKFLDIAKISLAMLGCIFTLTYHPLDAAARRHRAAARVAAVRNRPRQRQRLRTAAVGVLGALLSAIVAGRLRFKSLNEAATDTLRVTAMILWITLGAKAFISVFVATGGADSVLNFVESLEASRYVVLLAMLLVLIFLGLFLDEMYSSVMVMLLPLYVDVISAAMCWLQGEEQQLNLQAQC